MSADLGRVSVLIIISSKRQKILIFVLAIKLIFRMQNMGKMMKATITLKD